MVRFKNRYFLVEIVIPNEESISQKEITEKITFQNLLHVNICNIFILKRKINQNKNKSLLKQKLKKISEILDYQKVNYL